jgi:DNA sulfur modification protein DndC
MSASAFADTSLREEVKDLLSEIQELYREDNAPWIVGYSGGKDSTAVLQLIWLAIRELPPEQRTKDVHVISTDTLVENPVVAAWVTHSLLQMERSASEAGLPVRPNRLTPEVADTFWVNLIGKGYPAPRHKFRWCTERLKIKPSNAFITRIATASGQAILVLGSRKGESTARARNLTKHEKGRVRDRLSPNAGLANTLIYTPIESWTNDDVWLFLMQYENAWGYNNKDLLTMYQGASEDGECPLVVDTSTPSCGDSRFGCWVCTLVDKDKSMSAMIQNDEEKEWMLPLLRLRNELDVTDDRHLRDFRRMSGGVQLFHDRPIPGPYKQEAREHWLRRVLEAQRWIQQHAPRDVRTLELISRAELQEIRRIWVVDKHEIEDSLPRIYQETTGEPFDAPLLDDTLSLGAEEVQLLREIAGDDLQFELIRELLDVERRFQRMTRRAGLFNAIEGALRKSGYDDEQDATTRARGRRDALGAKELAPE